MNILAIDYGKKNIGLAWCDTGIGAPLPYGVIKDRNISELTDLIINEKIDKVIIGLPLGLDGRENANTAAAREFGGRLKSQIKASVEFFDERFTSAAADKLGGTVSRDEAAALVILQNYLDKINN
ncbi:MAG: Holliday junction resolvase RuvX [Patescibacteria group bacterium]